MRLAVQSFDLSCRALPDEPGPVFGLGEAMLRAVHRCLGLRLRLSEQPRALGRRVRSCPFGVSGGRLKDGFGLGAGAGGLRRCKVEPLPRGCLLYTSRCV